MEGERVCLPMKCSSSLLVPAVFLAALAPGQALTPTTRVRAVSTPSYHVRLEWQKALAGPGGLVIRGRITNTGSSPLTYTQVTPVLLDVCGKEVYWGSGYLTASPLAPGRSAEFRACEAAAPRFAGLRMEFREAGHPVQVEKPRMSAGPETSPPPIQSAKA